MSSNVADNPPPGNLPWPAPAPVIDRTWTTAEVTDLVAAVWRTGREAGLTERAATGAAELDRWWRNIGRRSYSEQLAARVAEFETHAKANYQQLGHPAGYQYRGGPVDYETGLPAGSACAWLRRYRSAPVATVTAIRRAA